MAQSKTITQSYQYQNNANSPVAVSNVIEPIVADNTLVVSYKDINPGVFTAGTPREGTVVNPQP